MTTIIPDDLYKFQEENGYFTADLNSTKTPFTIVIPPPNITGQLHIGHAFVMTMQDIVIRYKRMMGFDTLLLPGTDHAAIATQMMVEKHLATQGIERKKIGRIAFLDEVWKWKKEYSGAITQQLRKLGYSADWTRERFTMDDGMSDAVKEAFVRLYNEGLIYKDNRLVNWDPKMLTSVSDLEVNMVETNGSMWHLRYDIEDSKESIIVATTRPETMLGDTGIAVNPNDDRFKHLIGKFATLPIIGRKIEIVGDEYADMTKGTGAVKITPAHDFNDFEVGKRHNLPLINILTSTAKIDISQIENPNDFVKSLEGKDRFEARKLIIEKLKELGNLVKIEPYSHQVPHAERGGEIIEPRLTEQWYLNVSEMAKKSIELVEKGELKFTSKIWENTFFAWLRNIQPWCISRQLWWGHQIPAYYTDDGKIIVAKTKEEAQKIAGEGVNLTQDEDTLDTWFSSGLWPMSTLGWPNTENPDFKRYFPTSTLITGFDIIFFWVARMVMFSVHFTGKAPFNTVLCHGLICDEHGEKMSKTKGNVINPLELIEEFGIDTVRWTICTLPAQNRYISLGKSTVENSRKFITKLKNAINFWEQKGVKDVIPFNKSQSTSTTNWIIDKMNNAITSAKNAIENYRFDEYAQTIYHFVWDDFCDNFIELSKQEIESQNKEIILSTANIVIKNILKMLQPVIPFISAELWENMGYGKATEFINESFANSIEIDTSNTTDIDWMLNVISAIRNIRAENKIGFKTNLEIAFKTIPSKLEKYIQTIENHTNTKLTTENKEMASIVVDKDTTLLIQLPTENKNESIEKAKLELAEIEKRIISLNMQIKNMEGKAPAQIINDRKKSLEDAIQKQSQLKEIIG